jgi:hypothetical protein
MAIAFVNSDGLQGTSALGPSKSFTPGAGSDKLLIVGVGSIRSHFGGADNPPSSVTFGGSGLTKRQQSKYVYSANVSLWASLWYLPIAASVAAQTLQVNFSEAQSDFGVTILGYSGVDQTSPVVADAVGTGTTDPSSVTIGSASGEMCVDILSVMQATITKNVAGQTSRREEENVNFEYAAGSSDHAGAASVSMGWTFGTGSFGDLWSQVVMSLRAAGAGGPVSLILPRNPMAHMLVR